MRVSLLDGSNKLRGVCGSVSWFVNFIYDNNSMVGADLVYKSNVRIILMFSSSHDE